MLSFYGGLVLLLVSFEMCEMELFRAWTANQTVAAADLDLQLAAVEPIDSASPYFAHLQGIGKSGLFFFADRLLFFQALFGFPRDMCFLSKCLTDKVNGTVLEQIQFAFQMQDPTSIITAANLQTASAAYSSCWKGCFTTFHFYVRSRLAVHQRELWKVDRMRVATVLPRRWRVLRQFGGAGMCLEMDKLEPSKRRRQIDNFCEAHGAV